MAAALDELEFELELEFEFEPLVLVDPQAVANTAKNAAAKRRRMSTSHHVANRYGQELYPRGYSRGSRRQLEFRVSGSGIAPNIGKVAEIKAELLGNLWKITTSVGQHVEEDDTLMILESMKMEIPITTPTSGVVKEILVAEGDVVQEGQTVAIVE